MGHSCVGGMFFTTTSLLGLWNTFGFEVGFEGDGLLILFETKGLIY